MNEGELPPILVPPILGEPPVLAPPPLAEPPFAEAPPPARAKWRWAVHLLLLAGYVIGIGSLGSLVRGESGDGEKSALPGDVAGLLKVCVGELAMFGGVFVLACLFTRPSASQLFLKWRGGFKAWLWGALYSVGLRVGIAVVLFVIAIPIVAYQRVTEGEGADASQALKAFKPDVESLISPQALEDPLYLVVTMTLVSFVVAGFREELWRAGMMAGLAGLAPSLFMGRRGQIYAVLIAAAIFGVGHAPQGLAGVFLTGLLGIGLGLIIVRHQSVWEATIAHGFFDATSFAMLAALSKYAPDALKAL